MTTPGRAFVVFNPVSGASRAPAIADAAERALREAGYEAGRVPTREQGGARDVVRDLVEEHSALPERLIVLGGDGTLRETIEGLGPDAADVPIGIVPLGNANVVAYDFEIPPAPKKAIEIAVHGDPRVLDVGSVRTRDGTSSFLAMIGIGWDAHTVHYVDTVRRTRLGRSGYKLWADGLYGWAGVASALKPAEEWFSMKIDGDPLPRRYCAAWICNLPTYGKRMVVTPEADPSSGSLAVQARYRPGAAPVAEQVVSALRGVQVRPATSDHARGRELNLVAEERITYQIDGDPGGTVSWMEISVAPAAARIIARPR